MALKMLPAFKRLFEERLRLGRLITSPTPRFTFSPGGAARWFGAAPDEPTNVYFAHAQDPDSLESATAKAAWLDEAGQKKFRLGSFEAVERRLSINQGRILITTTPYDWGWLKQRVYDPWQASSGTHPGIDVIQFESIENPAFPRAEWDRARLALPTWKFDLFYRARFSRPAGLIYDSFDPVAHIVPRFALPPPVIWPRYLGLDFGGIHTAGILFAEEPETGKLYAYREYLPLVQRTAKEHVAALLAGEVGLPVAVGGSKSEGQWRAEFAAAGLPVREPDVTGADSVEVGIDRVYGAFRRGEVLVFSDLARLLDELASYSREVDDAGEVMEKIADKDSYHLLDATRYVLGWVRRPGGEAWDPKPSEEAYLDTERAPKGVWLS